MNLSSLVWAIAVKFDADIAWHEEQGIQLQRETLRRLLQDCYVTAMANYIQEAMPNEVSNEPD